MGAVWANIDCRVPLWCIYDDTVPLMTPAYTMASRRCVQISHQTISPGFSRVYFPSAPDIIVGKNKAKYTTNPNNEYFEWYKSLIEDQQSSGYYSATYDSHDYNISDAEKTKMEVAAQAICNYHQFEGVEYETETYIDYDGCLLYTSPSPRDS